MMRNGTSTFFLVYNLLYVGTYYLLGSYIYVVVAFSFLVVDDVRITGCIRHSNTEQLQFQKICLKIFQSFLLSEINLMLGTKLHGSKIKAGFDEFH